MKNVVEPRAGLVLEPLTPAVDLEHSVASISDDLRAILGQPPSRLHRFFEAQCDAKPLATALICGSERMTYGELDRRANRLANYLIGNGVAAGDAVGILLERSTNTYISLLAVLKAGAAFVPIDPSYPADRVSFIVADAALAALLTTSDRNDTAVARYRVIALDSEDAVIAGCSPMRPETTDSGDEVAYIIYTSGTTGRPKGVAVNHSNICHFLSVCTPIYGVTARDRVYQGMTIAFDFSIEEIWPTWIAGATLIAGPTDVRKIGTGLADFLTEQRVTFLYCVPTLLATIDRDIPSIHTLAVGGEACPRDLVERWSRPGRRMLNTYGPTETTVTATWTELESGKPVTIGRPLPGYRVYVVDEQLRPVAPGETGEICIGGLGVARGYVNRPALTECKFVADPFDRERTDARLYRTGDLGRFDENGDVEFLGRIDSQVKIRGYRIELGEIEASLLEDPAVENAIVSTVPIGAPAQDLVAYIVLRDHSAPIDDIRDRLARELRRRFPVYMVPAYVEVINAIPMLPSGKADRKQLPEPRLPRLSIRSGAFVPPATAIEEKLAGAWTAIFGRSDISVEDDFFLDLGGHSLFAAQAISRLRQQAEFHRLSVADLYANPTIRSLASCVERATGPAVLSERVRPEPRVHSNRRVWAAGLAQFSLLYGFLAILSAPIALLVSEHARKVSLFTVTRWDLILPVIALLMSIVVPVVLKWTLIGRFEAGTYPLWGSYYCRWWIVRKALEFSPMHMLAGSPLFAIYARLLGARIGDGAHVGTAQLHLPDLIEIGDEANVGYEVELQTFVVEEGWLHQSPIRIDARAYIGTKAVLMPGVTIGTEARVSEQSLVTRDQVIGAGESWSGSPASRSANRDALLDRMEAHAAPGSTASPLLWFGYSLAFVILELLPLVIAAPGVLVIALADRMGGRPWALAATPVAGLAFVLTACFIVAAGKRMIMPRGTPGFYRATSWFGLRKYIADKLMQVSLTLTNTLYATLYVVPFLRVLGARIGPRSEISTVSHIDPDLLVLGSETFVADLAAIGSATYHAGNVALERTVIGDRTFIGNASVVRSHTHLPENCLIGVQSVAPAETPQPGTSWLGSPAMYLPRRQSCEGFGESVTYRPPARLVAYRYFVEFFRIVLPPALLYVLGTSVTIAALQLVTRVSPTALVALMPALYFATAFTITTFVAAVKWAVVGKYRPRIEPLWAPFVRHTEFITGLYESVVVPVLAGLLTGTPLIAPLLRGFGVSVGRRVWLETSFMTEFDLVHVEADAAIGRAASLQTHLFEDRVMKMSKLQVGAGASVGSRAVVLYDATVGERTHLDALSLAMKGESLPPSSDWCGIPAKLH